VHRFGARQKPIFIVADVVPSIGYRNARHVHEWLDDDEKFYLPVVTKGGVQKMPGTDEPGLYKILARGKTPIAKGLYRLVCREVPPSLREHGCYPPPRTLGSSSTSEGSILRIDPCQGAGDSGGPCRASNGLSVSEEPSLAPAADIDQMQALVAQQLGVLRVMAGMIAEQKRSAAAVARIDQKVDANRAEAKSDVYRAESKADAAQDKVHRRQDH
jgi:hypothetical protein